MRLARVRGWQGRVVGLPLRMMRPCWALVALTWLRTCWTRRSGCDAYVSARQLAHCALVSRCFAWWCFKLFPRLWLSHAVPREGLAGQGGGPAFEDDEALLGPGGADMAEDMLDEEEWV